MKNIKNGNALRARILGKVFASARLLLAAYLVSSIVEPAALSAGVPPGINYQGRYVADNVPFTGNKSNCQFKIYDDPTSGTLRWSSPAVSLDFDRGLFNYVIACSTHDWRTYESYLEVVIDGVTLSPRERLQASPYAFFSSSAAYSYDADKIDNIDSSALVQIAGNQNITGVKTFTSSVTVTGAGGLSGAAGGGAGANSLRISSGVYIGQSQTDRWITDDAANYATRFSSNVYISGVIRADYSGITILELWKEGSGGNYALSATGGADLGGCGTMLDGTWFHPSGNIQVRLYVNVDSITGGTYNFQLHNVTDNNYPVINTDGTMSGTTSGMKDSGWKNTTVNGLKWVSLYGWVSGSTTNFNPAILLVRPQLP
ncbi:MAG: hypothetical protein CVU77_01330 [Elusimicrobia bacterium HGW-Elusimicrobia-1]|nr:MAG: hypothetical protein CVU77_01330 [Elusimicrobia bacterium HGW-Elusimicrobia-1]